MVVESRGIVSFDVDEEIRNEIESMFGQNPLFDFEEEFQIDFSTPERQRQQ